MQLEFAHIIKHNKVYCSQESSDIKMCILSHFLTDDVSCSSIESYIGLAYDPEFRGGCANATCMEKENGYVSICLEVDVREEEDQANAIWLKLTIEQYINILENWRDKVCKERPSEVIIRYENDKFAFDIK